MFLKRKCPICGTQFGELIKRVPLNLSIEMREKIKYPYYYDLVSCNQCGMLFADTELSKEEIDNYYIQCNMYDSMSSVKEDIYIESCNLYFEAILPYLTQHSRIIDIGCGNGMFLKFLKDRGYTNLYGIDPSESSINNLNKNGITGIVGSAYDKIPSEWSKKFDVVISTGVLEHLLFPDICLTGFINLMKETGILYIAVPNAMGFKKYLRDIPNYFNQEHINFFTPKTLDYFFNKRGLFRCSSDEECYHVVVPNSPEMVISAVYTLSCNKKESIKVFDEEGKKSIIEYFYLVEEKQEKNKKELMKLLKTDEKIAIWGTGGLSGSLLNDIPELADKVEFFVDNDINRQGKFYWRKKIIAPSELKLYPDVTIIICVMLNRDSVINQIRTMKILNKIFLLS